ncbi:hypothetical protein LTR81_024447 [Elasticomyces elasticus]
MSALVVLRQPPYKNDLVALQGGVITHPTQALVAIAVRLACLLNEQDSSAGRLEAENVVGLLVQFSQIRTELEAFLVTQRLVGKHQEQHEYTRQSFDLDPDLLKAAVMQGYASALLVQTATAAWQILQSKAIHSLSVDAELPLTKDHVQLTCVDHVLLLRRIITELASERYGMLTAAPLLFMIESAFKGYTALAQYHGGFLIFCHDEPVDHVSHPEHQHPPSDVPFGRTLATPGLRNLTYPPYAINNFLPGHSLQKPVISPDATHNDGPYNSTEYELHSLYGHTSGNATYNALRAVTPQQAALLHQQKYVQRVRQLLGHWEGDTNSRWGNMYFGISQAPQFSIALIPVGQMAMPLKRLLNEV